MTTLRVDELGRRAPRIPGYPPAGDDRPARRTGGSSSRPPTRTRRTAWTWARLLAAAATLVVLVWRLGTGPFIDGVETIDATALAAGVGLLLVTTLCAAWRWRIVARGLGVELTLPAAVAAYYRSQFLNVTLPGGVVGDVHRGVSHGQDVSDVGRGLRAVWWERAAGQGVQVVLAVAVLVTLPSPVRSEMPLVAGTVVVAILGVLLLARVRPSGRSRLARIRNAAAGDVRSGLLARRAWPGVTIASVLAVAGYVATFMIAAHTAGVAASTTRLLPLALLALLAMVLPNVAGWGPREGVTAWAFGAAGLGAAQGVTTAVVFGVMTFVASLPGAVVLVVGWLRGGRSHAGTRPPRSGGIRVAVRSDGAADA
jgi:glycosyltransferase 2 family protein